MWNPATLNLKQVLVTSGPAEPKLADWEDADTTLTVQGAGFVQGMTLVFLRTDGQRTISEIIPVNQVTVDPGAPFQLTAKVNAVKKEPGDYDLIAWLPSPNNNVPPGCSHTVNDVAVLEKAVTVISKP